MRLGMLAVVLASVALGAVSTAAWASSPESTRMTANDSDRGSGSGSGSDREACGVPPEFKTLWPAPDAVVFHPTTLEERRAFEQLVPELLTKAQLAKHGDGPPRGLIGKAQQVGFDLVTWTSTGETFWVLRERADARRGAGAYVLRVGPAADIVLQSPHAYYDLGTDALGAALFTCAPADLRPRAFLTNTAHRFRGRPGERRDDADHPADVAHNPHHLFQIVTDSMVKKLGAARVIQLHGFGANEGRRAKLAAVVSAGSRAPTPYTKQMAARLSDVLGEGVRLFPDETEALGGTRNAQARLIQAYPRSTFVHLELSAEVRRALGAQDRLEALARALFAPESEALESESEEGR